MLAVAGAVWFAVTALRARDALQAATDDVPALERALRAGETDQARTLLAGVRERTQEARSATSGPVWAVASRAPVVGHDVAAVRTAAGAVDDLADAVLPPLVDAADEVTLDRLTPAGGRVDLEPLRRAQPLVTSAAAALDGVRARLATVDTATLDPHLAGPLDQLAAKTDELDALVSTAHRATALLPAMLGGDGTRRYLLLSLNNAELRASGGIPGSVTELETHDGTVRITGTASAADLGPFGSPVTTVPRGDRVLYSDNVATHLQDTTLTPDFPTTGRVVAAMWERSGRGKVDGVLSADPVALSFLLGATGPVDVAVPATAGLPATSVQVTRDNAVTLLLSTVYARVRDPRAQDAFFAATASAVVDRLTSERGVPAEALQQSLVQASDERRLLVWSAHEDEQALLAPTQLSGALTTTDRGGAALGVFLDDGTRGKMGYYLRATQELRASTCGTGGTGATGSGGGARAGAGAGTATFTLRLRSVAPKDAARSLSDYVTGGGTTVEPGVIRTNVTVYSPVGSAGVELSEGGRPFGAETQTFFSRSQTMFTVDLAPGASRTWELTVPVRCGDGPLEVWSTPTTTVGGLTTVALDR